jgi:hypothetical protein
VRLGSFFRNPETDRVVIAQWPNLPLALFLVASIVARVADIAPARFVAAGALAWWSIAELADGDSPFRRGLGGVVLTFALVGLLTR